MLCSNEKDGMASDVICTLRVDYYYIQERNQVVFTVKVLGSHNNAVRIRLKPVRD